MRGGRASSPTGCLTTTTTPTPPDEDRLAAAAADLLVPEEFLRELEELLKEKGQLIFYGPPGTGKTYLADRFAAALQPDPERRMLVQFHPSMSYEDFFEGYRPQVDERKQMYYELRSGPLALMVEKAEAAPGVPHILIIDEINRANLPRVFGELLFLLEYRNKAVRTAYRPDEPFELPKNLFFIGTMNTADRSIAMVDAALRRRFHFIPFMPHEGPMASLLSDWLKKYQEPAWVAVPGRPSQRAAQGPAQGAAPASGAQPLHGEEGAGRRDGVDGRAPGADLGVRRLPVHRGPALRPAGPARAAHLD